MYCAMQKTGQVHDMKADQGDAHTLNLDGPRWLSEKTDLAWSEEYFLACIPAVTFPNSYASVTELFERIGY